MAVEKQTIEKYASTVSYGSTPAIHTKNDKVRATASLTGSIAKQGIARKIGRDVSVVKVIGIVVLLG